MRLLQSMIVSCATLALVGCMTAQPLTVNGQLSSQLERGDKVEVVTKSGQRLQFAIENVDEQGVRGAGQQVAYADMQSISRNKVDVGRTTLIVLGAAAVAALAAAGGGGGSSGY